MSTDLTSTAPPAWLDELRSPIESLPDDLVVASGKRVRIAALAFALVWVVMLALVNPLARLMTGDRAIGGAWPMPGNLFALIGLGLSLALAGYASVRGVPPSRVLWLAVAHQVVTAALLALINNWAPYTPGISLSTLVLILPIYPAIAPIPFRWLAVAAFLSACMDPLTWAFAGWRGTAIERTAFIHVADFAATYVAAAISLLPATIIRRLGHQVQEARSVGAYTLGRLLGKGGMGEVYEATHRLLARKAAVKLVTHQQDEDHATNERAMERFRREAAVAAALTSPHTIELYDFGLRADGQYYYVMELLEGMDLQDMVDRYGPLPSARVAHFLHQAAKSLAEAHEFGMVHRDIKPSNLFVSRRGLELDFIKVLDFGIVKLGADRPPVQDELKLTMVEAPIGTPAFMPPEGVEGAGHLSAASDIYSLGCTAFWMLTGELPFRAGNLMQMLYKHVNEAPRKPSAVHGTPIPEALDELVLRCLSKSPAARPADGKALLGEIEPIAAATPWTQADALRWWASVARPAA
ncbi:MAG TPA: serine/threonine-protein kinase [Gemmatimonadales bacterium]